MSKSLVYFLLLASITSAYAESAVLDQATATTPQVKELAKSGSHSSKVGFDDEQAQALVINPITVGQNPTAAEQLDELAFAAITSPQAKDLQIKNITPSTVETAKKSDKTTQPVLTAKAAPANAVKQPAPVPANLSLDKTLLEQMTTAKAAPVSAIFKADFAPAMLAENTEPTVIALQRETANKYAQPTSGLFGLPVIPVGRVEAEKAQEVAMDASPAPGSLGAHAIPVAKMVATKQLAKPVVARVPVGPALSAATPVTLANNERILATATNMLLKSSLDKVLLSNASSSPIALDKTTATLLAPAMVAMAGPSMLALATPSEEGLAQDISFLQQIAAVNIWPVMKAKNNHFSIAMIEKLTGVKGVFDAKENIYKISVPRDDLNIIVNGVKLTSAMGLTSWFTFKNNIDTTSLQGNLVLTEEQVNAVMFAAIENNLNVTELHNHYLWESPKVIFMHIEAEGDAKKLADAVGKVLAKIKDTGQGNGEFPIAQIDTANTTLSPDKIEKILGAKGAITDGVYQIRVAKSAQGVGTLPPDPAKGANTLATFAGSDDEAVVDGDIAMQSPGLQKVLRALHDAGISIVALHERTINDRARYVFLHYWGVGKTSDLARGLRTALDASVAPG